MPEGGHAAPDGCLSCNIAQVAALLRPASRLKCVWPPCPHHAGQTEAVISPFAMGANHADSNQTSCCSTPRGTEGHQMATAAHEEVCPCSPEINKCTCAVFCGMLLCWCAWSCMAADVSETDRHIHVSLLLDAISYSAEYADLRTPLWHLPVPRQVQTVLQISRGALDGRRFASGYANPKKAHAVRAAMGLQAVLVLDKSAFANRP